jgi:hypothetical protein
MHVLIAAVLVFLALSAQADIVERVDGESPEVFAKRMGPEKSELVHPVIETDAWQMGHRALIAFFGHTVNLGVADDPYYIIDGIVFLPESQNRYRQFRIPRIEPEGGDPRIQAVFFANADPEPDKELAVIISWEQLHYEVRGTLYGTMIYARPKDVRSQSFEYLEKISEEVSGSCECHWHDGTKAQSRFKTAAEVKEGLAKMGYK